MDLINDADLKRVLIEMLDDFAQFCDAHGYRYVLDCGTLIGAVRHHGFIPWDDDIDIAMPREDFERAFHEYQHPYYRALCHSNCHSFSGLWGKLYDTRTTSLKGKHFPTPVSIDVYPWDRLPKNPRVRWRQYQLISVLRYANFAANTPFGMTTHYIDNNYIVGRWRWRYYYRSLVKNVMIAFFRFTSAAFWGWLADRASQMLPQTDDLECLTTAHNPYRTPLTEAYFNHRKKVPFEDRSFWISEGYDKFLWETYGNYMVPPPEEMRVARHVTQYVWKDGAKPEDF